MANTRDIRRRIRSVENTRQITRAMEMVAATKMRKAQQQVVISRDYAAKAGELFRAVTAAGVEEKLPLLEVRPVKRQGLVVLGSDRGLCGAMNVNVVRLATQQSAATTKFVALGRKSQNAVRSSGGELLASFTGLLDTPHFTEIVPVARLLIDEFTAGNLDQISLVYPKFVSTLQNQPTVERLLPAQSPGGRASSAQTQGPAPGADAPEAASRPVTGAKALTVFEPSPEAVLTELLPRLIEIQLWQALLETKASEHSSRMIAMRNASNNASDLLDELRFNYNQIRQAVVTTEIAEIAAAAAV